MPENAHLNGCIDRIELEFVEREATPQLLMKLGIQLHLAGLSLSNTVSILDIFGVKRARSTVHNWVHKAELQPEEGQSPDHVAVDETVIRLNDEQYWLYAAVDSEINELLYTRLEPTRNNALAHTFFRELCEKHDIDDAVILIYGATPLNDAGRRHDLISDTNVMEIGIASNMLLYNMKLRNTSLFNCFNNTEANTANE